MIPVLSFIPDIARNHSELLRFAQIELKELENLNSKAALPEGVRQRDGIFRYAEPLHRNTPHFTEVFFASGHYKMRYWSVTGGYAGGKGDWFVNRSQIGKVEVRLY